MTANTTGPTTSASMGHSRASSPRRSSPGAPPDGPAGTAFSKLAGGGFTDRSRRTALLSAVPRGYGWPKGATSAGGADDGSDAVSETADPGPAFLPEECRHAARSPAGHAACRVHGQHGGRRRPRMAALGRPARPAAAVLLPAPHPALPGLAPRLPVLFRALAEGFRADGDAALVGLDVGGGAGDGGA